MHVTLAKIRIAVPFSTFILDHYNLSILSHTGLNTVETIHADLNV